jgi:hypothetical protein
MRQSFVSDAIECTLFILNGIVFMHIMQVCEYVCLKYSKLSLNVSDGGVLE